MINRRKFISSLGKILGGLGSIFLIGCKDSHRNNQPPNVFVGYPRFYNDGIAIYDVIVEDLDGKIKNLGINNNCSINYEEINLKAFHLVIPQEISQKENMLEVIAMDNNGVKSSMKREFSVFSKQELYDFIFNELELEERKKWKDISDYQTNINGVDSGFFLNGNSIKVDYIIEKPYGKKHFLNIAGMENNQNQALAEWDLLKKIKDYEGTFILRMPLENAMMLFKEFREKSGL